MTMLPRRSFLAAGLALPALASATGLHWQERSLLGFGTTLRLQAGAADERPLTLALDAAVRALREVEAAMNLFQPDSEVSRLNRDGRLVRPSAHLQAVLGVARQVSAASHGAFDVTVQPLWQLYEQARAAGRLPSPQALQAARARVGWQHLRVDERAVSFDRPGMALTLNGIAQGYAADVARDTLREHGVARALVDAGEFAALGTNRRAQPWRVGIEDPHAPGQLIDTVALQGRCIATSSDLRGAFTPDRRHHQLFDPATGDSPPALSSVSVVADRAVLADALTKVMFVAGPAGIPALARQWGVDVQWVDKAGTRSSSVVLL
jgi:thiamine biosynthesis lipoprotein